jgi:hypothetical protein
MRVMQYLLNCARVRSMSRVSFDKITVYIATDQEKHLAN